MFAEVVACAQLPTVGFLHPKSTQASSFVHGNVPCQSHTGLRPQVQMLRHGDKHKRTSVSYWPRPDFRPCYTLTASARRRWHTVQLCAGRAAVQEGEESRQRSAGGCSRRFALKHC